LGRFRLIVTTRIYFDRLLLTNGHRLRRSDFRLNGGFEIFPLARSGYRLFGQYWLRAWRPI
jgi:hypothetical protein